jgi:hypothetical protein
MMKRALLGCLALSMVMGAAVTASSATPEEVAVARRLFREAEQGEKKGQWAEALQKLERVVAIKETAGVRFHIAVCNEKLGHLVKALESYERAKALAAETDTRDVLDMIDPEIERMRARIGTVRVEVPEGVGPLIVHVDQAVYANLPPGEVVRLDPGTHQVIVKIDGKVRLDRLVSVDEGQSETLHVRDWRPKAPVASEPVASDAKPQPAADVQSSTSGVPSAAWVSFGAGAVLGVGGYLSYAKADSVADESATACAKSIACDPGRADAVRRWDALALGMWVGAAVGVGTGIALTLASGQDGKPATAMVVSPSQVQIRTSF